MTESIDSRIAELQRKIKARRGYSNFRDNVREMEAEITSLQARKARIADLAGDGE